MWKAFFAVRPQRCEVLGRQGCAPLVLQALLFSFLLVSFSLFSPKIPLLPFPPPLFFFPSFFLFFFLSSPVCSSPVTPQSSSFRPASFRSRSFYLLPSLFASFNLSFSSFLLPCLLLPSYPTTALSYPSPSLLFCTFCGFITSCKLFPILLVVFFLFFILSPRLSSSLPVSRLFITALRSKSLSVIFFFLLILSAACVGAPVWCVWPRPHHLTLPHHLFLPFFFSSSLLAVVSSAPESRGAKIQFRSSGSPFFCNCCHCRRQRCCHTISYRHRPRAAAAAAAATAPCFLPVLSGCFSRVFSSHRRHCCGCSCC